MSLSRPTINSVRKSRALSRLSSSDFTEDGVDIKLMLEQVAAAAATEEEKDPAHAATLVTVEEMDVAADDADVDAESGAADEGSAMEES